MRRVSFINIVNIIVDRHSISPQTFDLAKKLESGEVTPEGLTPIKTINQSGTHILKDGRHRVTAFKLVGLKQIKARYYDKTGI